MAIVLQKPTAEHVVKEESYAAFPLKSRKAKTRMPIIITFIHHHLLLLPRKIARRKRTNKGIGLKGKTEKPLLKSDSFPIRRSLRKFTYTLLEIIEV